MLVKHLTKYYRMAYLARSANLPKGLYIFQIYLKRGAPVFFVHFLQNWYSRMQCCVMWNNMMSDAFPILCGVCQGGVLSPYLFAVYVDDLITQLRQSGHGIHVGQYLLAVNES